MISPNPKMSVIICTRNRAESLKVTLECLASAKRENVSAEIVVVDNASNDHTKEVAESFGRRIPVRYLYEPTLGTFGKSHALNRALDAGGLGEIIAVLDDDISADHDWFEGVAAICERWPNKDIFTGRGYIIWPVENPPKWAKSNKLVSGIYSATDYGDTDKPLEDGRWYNGGYFWFRARVLSNGRRFKDIWLTEPDFMLDLVEEGYSGVAGPDATAGHRIQLQLLEEKVAVERSRKIGVCFARVRLQPYRQRVKQARLFRQHPLLARIFCGLNCFRWATSYVLSYFFLTHDSRVAHRIHALERMVTYREFLLVASQNPEYSIWKHRSSK
jgi:glycosyltransferase involved in cell wall biosynthesis